MKQEIAMILLLWFALQIPLGIVIGKCIGFGTAEARNNKRQASSPASFGPGVTKWWRSGFVTRWQVRNVPSQFVTAKYRQR